MESIINVFLSLPAFHVYRSIIVVTFIALALWLTKALKMQTKQYFKVVWLLPFIVEIIYQTAAISYNDWKIENSLPLEFSYITSIFASIYFFKAPNKVHGLVYFCGAWSAAAAFLNTNLIGNEPWYLFVRYYGHHGALLYYAAHSILIGFRPVKRDFIYAISFTSIVIIVGGIFNQIFNLNYMFTQSKPGGINLSSTMPPWPWYFVIILLIGLFFYTILFYLGRRKGQSSLVRHPQN